jgi:hypothetical protein
VVFFGGKPIASRQSWDPPVLGQFALAVSQERYDVPGSQTLQTCDRKVLTEQEKEIYDSIQHHATHRALS